MIIRDGRVMARVATIDAITAIPDADAIEAAQIGGWQVVVRKGLHTTGERVVYFEIDTALPAADPRWEFLARHGTKRDLDGGEWVVLRTARFRGAISQGLVQSLTDVGAPLDAEDGADLTEFLGVAKWEKPLPAGTTGTIIGPWDSRRAPKTDAERVQNLVEAWPALLTETWVATEKVDGTSLTVWWDDDGAPRVFSREWEIGEGDNAYWTGARLLGDLPGFTVQAEVVGPGIQGNRLRLPQVRALVFAVWRDRQPLPRSEWPGQALAHAVPVLDLPLPATPAEAVALVDGMASTVNPAVQAEGVVWHADRMVPVLGRNTIKAVNNTWLLKAKD